MLVKAVGRSERSGWQEVNVRSLPGILFHLYVCNPCFAKEKERREEKKNIELQLKKINII